MAAQSIQDKYFTVLKNYIANQEEAQLLAAADLGRELVGANIPTEEIAEIHEAALQRLARESPGLILLDAARLISTPLMELLMAYGLAFRARREIQNLQTTALEAAANAIIITNSKGNIVWANPAFFRLSGYPAEEVIGQNPRFLKSGQQDRAFYQKLWATITAGQVWYGELINKRRDGSLYPEEMTITPVRDERGQISHFIAVKQDITERKQAEQQLEISLKEKETLLRELYHRTKNNMQVIHAILALRSAYVQDEQLLTVLEDVQDKIQAMALVHQKLYEARNLSSIDLQEYINDLAAHLLKSYQVKPDRISLELETDRVFVLIDTAIPCGLILSELISNALKHAFPGDRAGRIKIQLHRAEDETITFQVSDNGIGVPGDFDVRKSDSLGLQTVLGIVEHQLHGEITLETEQGMVWQIRFRDSLYRPRV